MGCVNGLAGRDRRGGNPTDRLEALGKKLRPQDALMVQALSPTSIATHASLKNITAAAEARTSRAAVASRYKRLPKRLEDDYEVAWEEVLGTGYNGAVVLARSRRDKNAKFAVKSFRLQSVASDLLEAETAIFLEMDHPHVARLVDIYESDSHVHMVMEYTEGGEVLKRLTEQKRYAEKDASHAVRQMLLAVNYIHSRGVVHKDLKLQNFLYQRKDSMDHLKLIDFGFSQIWDSGTVMNRCCGTLAYTAPEVLKGRYTSQCDLWSLGIIVFVLLAGYMPFRGDDLQVRQAIAAGACDWREERWKHVSEEGTDFVKKLLEVDPDKRMTAHQALKHPWIKTVSQRTLGSLGDPPGETHDTTVLNALAEYAKATQFRRACMLLMAWSLSDDERAKVCDFFLAVDKSQRGTITKDELRDVLVQVESPEDLVGPIFDALDTSENKEILYTEFLAAMVSTRIKMHGNLLKSTFERMDTDHSGCITVDNLKEVFGETFCGTKVDEMIQDADFEQNGKISYDEFEKYFKNELSMSSGQFSRQTSPANSHSISRKSTALFTICEEPAIQDIEAADLGLSSSSLKVSL